MNVWLVLDCNYLCYRAFHTFRNLSHDLIKTGVVYGFLRDLLHLQDLHGTSRVAFCFDRGISKRTELYPAYKADRRPLEQEQLLQFNEVRAQIELLRESYLPQVGFHNVFSEPGFEADDVIASVCSTISKAKQRAVIISSDQDLLQLLRNRVSIFNPHKKKAVTKASFIRDYGILPRQWVDVKSIAGCKSDNIRGVPGVGEATALKFVAKQLKTTTKAYQNIVLQRSTWERNRRLVQLPFPSTPEFDLRDDHIRQDVWQAFADVLGMKSLRNAFGE